MSNEGSLSPQHESPETPQSPAPVRMIYSVVGEDNSSGCGDEFYHKHSCLQKNSGGHHLGLSEEYHSRWPPGWKEEGRQWLKAVGSQF